MKLSSESIPDQHMIEAAKICYQEPLRTFLKENWKPYFGDWVYSEPWNLLGVAIGFPKKSKLIIEWMYDPQLKPIPRADRDQDILFWIPMIGYQIENLLIKLLEYMPENILIYRYIALKFSSWKSERTMSDNNKPDFLLKIIWLNEILKKRSKK